MASPSALILAALAALAPAGPQSPLAVAKKASADYRKAMMGMDVSYFERNTTKDFTFVGTNGMKESRNFALSSIREGFKAYRKIKTLDQRIVSARRAEGGVVMVADTHMEATLKMGGKVGNLVSESRGEVLLVPAGKGWAYKRIKMLKEDTKFDGKPMKGM